MAKLIQALPYRNESPSTSSHSDRRLKLWIDPLCCPVEKESKKISLERIRAVYENSAHVLVLDASVSQYSVENTHPMELLARIYGISPWTRRLWTLQGRSDAWSTLMISAVICDYLLT